MTNTHPQKLLENHKKYRAKLSKVLLRLNPESDRDAKIIATLESLGGINSSTLKKILENYSSSEQLN